jgi:hypothetical protein
LREVYGHIIFMRRETTRAREEVEKVSVLSRVMSQHGNHGVWEGEIGISLFFGNTNVL